MQKIVGILWRRHWVEVVVFLGSSFLLSGLIWKGDRLQSELGTWIWLEGAAGAWLIGRVAMSQTCFGSFGDFRTRPHSWVWYRLAEICFLIVALVLVISVRLSLGGGSGALWASMKTVGMFYGLCVLAGVLMAMSDRPKRSGLALGVVFGAAIFGGYGTYKGDWGRAGESLDPLMYGGGKEQERVFIDPTGLDGVEDWQWLRCGYAAGEEGILDARKADLLKLPLELEARGEGAGMQAVVKSIEVKDDWLHLEVDVVEKGAKTFRRSYNYSLLVKYGNGFYAHRVEGQEVLRHLSVPLLARNRTRVGGRFLSPRLLPENEATWDELLDGAEIWIGKGKGPGLSPESFVKWEPKRDEAMSVATQFRLGNGHWTDSFLGELKNSLMEDGEARMDEVLALRPWTKKSWEAVGEPYFSKFATEKNLPGLLGLYENYPVVGDFLVKKDWAAEAMPVMRKHLQSGKTLGRRSVVELIRLGEPGMGPDLENQLLRMGGNFDAVAAELQKHPGVDWNRLRKEAWKRVETGFGSHHVWKLWGAEMGEKEALRMFVEEAHSGKKWERQILEGWFGKKKGLIGDLRSRWSEVQFQNGKWGFGK